MFTGIVTAIGTVVESERKGPSLKRLAIACPYEAAGIEIGASIACAGVCLTVTALRPRTDGEPGCIFQVEAAAETLSKTLVGEWEVGSAINLERSLKVGDELGGHLVTGHVDGVGQILTIEPIAPDPDEPWGATARFHIRAPQGLPRFIAAKGSICLDGTSLTVNTVEDDVFTVLLIPHSFAVTTWGQRKAGDPVHVEVDLMARYAARLAEARAEV
ncbi:MAG: riboflavin synthase [Bosea sp. (in: a-proteobacteria)]|jgi:riboflavin synthase|uniref:riboflavin synthase n=1 Tax=Bosea sp. (in: a-proteobacteria) TaxID=1871050 RepID=UPI001E01ED43|nr:riboflavin synthase [Bosea sp. (in: a-proteobacteria)]MBA4334667.1 riboflavin synthase [Methylobacterium sp.]MBX9875415.1 riboflavin synthase [Beijerinckiaceae bacterium]MDP3602504.1 riboflavin synthase [Bosea sp. (in: a-proteobacteria)]